MLLLLESVGPQFSRFKLVFKDILTRVSRVLSKWLMERKAYYSGMNNTLGIERHCIL